MKTAGWGLGAVLRLHVPAARAAAFEADVRRQVAEVDEHEPGTLVYGFYREEVSGDRATYLHTMVYADRAAQEAHWAKEAVWWWDAFSDYLEAPIESERFTDDALLRAWSSTGPVHDSLVVAIVDPWDVDSLGSPSSEGYGWARRVVSSEDPSVLHARSPGVLVVTSTRDADEAGRLAERLHVVGGNVRIGSRLIAGVLRDAATIDLEQEA